jgi:hypothetical protein
VFLLFWACLLDVALSKQKHLCTYRLPLQKGCQGTRSMRWAPCVQLLAVQEVPYMFVSPKKKM